MLQKHIDKLAQIRSLLANLSDEIYCASEDMLKGLEKKDVKSFSNAIEILENISSKGKEIDNEILISLALFGAEASDLRELVAYLKITNEMMRECDNIKSFSKRITPIVQENIAFEANKEYAVHLCKASLRAVDMVSQMLKSQDKEEILDLYRKIQVQESKSDDFYSLLEKEIFSQLSKSNEFSVDHMNILSIMRKLERIADRALDISKLLVFAIDGGELNVY